MTVPLARLVHDLQVGPPVHFQPIVRLDDGRPVGHEALVRPAGRTPGEWFAVADHHGLRTEAEVAAIRSAISGLPRLPLGTYLSVNASVSTVLQEDFIEAVEPVSPRLMLEITENEAIRVAQLGPLRTQLARVRRVGLKEGIRLAVDDFGSGEHDNLSFLRRLHPDCIKLDVTFTVEICQEGADGRWARAIVAAVVQLASETDAIVVAEGVETERQRVLLRDGLRVLYGQGYLLGRPVALERVA